VNDLKFIFALLSAEPQLYLRSKERYDGKRYGFNSDMQEFFNCEAISSGKQRLTECVLLHRVNRAGAGQNFCKLWHKS